jgi:hypothetical protein
VKEASEEKRSEMHQEVLRLYDQVLHFEYASFMGDVEVWSIF